MRTLTLGPLCACHLVLDQQRRKDTETGTVDAPSVGFGARMQSVMAVLLSVTRAAFSSDDAVACASNMARAVAAFGSVSSDAALDMLALPSMPDACAVTRAFVQALASERLISKVAEAVLLAASAVEKEPQDVAALWAALSFAKLVRIVTPVLCIQRLAVLNGVDMLAPPSAEPRPWAHTRAAKDVLCVPPDADGYASAAALAAEGTGLVLQIFPRTVSDVLRVNRPIEAEVPVVPVSFSPALVV